MVRSSNFYRRFEIDRACDKRLYEIREQFWQLSNIICDPASTDDEVSEAYAERRTLDVERAKLYGWKSRPSTADLEALGLIDQQYGGN